MCLCECMLGVQGGQQRASEPLQLGLQAAVISVMWDWGPLEEQQVLLTAEPPLQWKQRYIQTKKKGWGKDLDDCFSTCGS